ncbi:acyl-homoserine-lactone synthase [Piscinibacter sp.]|uniref:acyl-homoserine-lactone synthase n=1 Tax=Piscinibacter sp. TaxID=1903157 RepID=UPI0039E23062
MRIACFADSELTDSSRCDIARYRYRVFVGQLGWDLPVPHDHDQDGFDVAYTRHVVATEVNTIVGYARLLPTTRPYLLRSVFPDLLNGGSAPCDEEVWELSRYAATDLRHGDASPDISTIVGKALLLEAMRVTQAQGAHTLVFCTTVAVERLSRRWGMDTRRLGPTKRTSAGLLVAAAMSCKESNMHLLAEGQVQQAHPPRPAGLRMEFRDGLLSDQALRT